MPNVLKAARSTVLRSGYCRCGNRLFFRNHQCVGCGAEVGLCDGCNSISSFSETAEADNLDRRCDACSVACRACDNRAKQVCNVYTAQLAVCTYCAHTTVHPDISQDQYLSAWRSLELAKRRLIVQLRTLRLPPYGAQPAAPLIFQFLADDNSDDGEGRVITGHAQGTITINVAEADPVHRERTRVQFGEPQRTLIGHCRHEYGHYLDWVCTDLQNYDAAYCQLFGDPRERSYDEARETYYAQGSPANWMDNFVSAYATMHPWEDLAETVNLYLDLMVLAELANYFFSAKIDLSPAADMAELVPRVQKFTLSAGELNAAMGLPFLLHEQLSAAVMRKLAYVHFLRRQWS